MPVAAILDEGGLQGRFYASDFGEVDIAAKRALGFGFEIEILNPVARDDGHAGLFPVGRVDQHFLAHRRILQARRRWPVWARGSTAVGRSGRARKPRGAQIGIRGSRRTSGRRTARVQPRRAMKRAGGWRWMSKRSSVQFSTWAVWGERPPPVRYVFSIPGIAISVREASLKRSKFMLSADPLTCGRAAIPCESSEIGACGWLKPQETGENMPGTRPCRPSARPML